ncbi:MAG: hypothetical protein MHMPM18_000781 [Marteilia pararefringens]
MLVLGLLHTMLGYLSTFGFVALAVPLIFLAVLWKARQNSAEAINNNNGGCRDTQSGVTQTTIYELPPPAPSSPSSGPAPKSPESPTDTKSNNQLLQFVPPAPTPNNRRPIVAPSDSESGRAENKL